MATSFTPHTLFISHPLSRPTSRPTLTAPPPQPPSPPPQTTFRATNSSESESQQPIVQQSEVETETNKRKGSSWSRKVESTDWIASSLTRRFGLGAGLAWAGFLAFGVVSEQIKTRLEVSQQEANTRDVEKAEEVILPNGIRYYELRIGGGGTPRIGDLMVIDLKGIIKDNDAVFVDTFSGENKRPLALVMGSRPYTRGMCEGIEYVLMTMKAGGKRRVIIPPNLGFGSEGADFGSGVVIPPFATLEYIVQVDKVSIAPA